MIRVFTSADPILVGYLRSLLEDRGIECLVRNEFLHSGAGELPLNETWPELWIIDPRDEQLALNLIKESQTPDEENTEPWICNHCGETLEPQFQVCWQCGALKA